MYLERQIVKVLKQIRQNGTHVVDTPDVIEGIFEVDIRVHQGVELIKRLRGCDFEIVAIVAEPGHN